MLFYFTVCLSSIYTINYFCVFPVLRKYRLHKNTHQCKILHCTWRRLVRPAEILYTFKKSFYVVSGFAFLFFILYVKPIRSLLIQRIPAGSSFRLLTCTFYCSKILRSVNTDQFYCTTYLPEAFLPYHLLHPARVWWRFCRNFCCYH